MDKLALRLMIRDEELRAIGHVAAQWAYLETKIDTLISLLDSHASQNGRVRSDRQSSAERVAKLRSLAREILTGAPLEELLDILEKSSSLRGFRDDIVHGTWHLHRNGGELTTGITVLSRRPSFKSKTVKFTAEKAEGIAAKISKQSVRITVWRTKYVRLA